MSDQASKAVNAALDAQFATDQETFQTNLDKDNDKRLQQQLLSTVTDLHKLQDIEDAKRTDQTLARIEAVNAQSTALQTHANEMQQDFDASMKYRQESTDFALKEALARGGNAAFTGQKRQDLMADVDVEGYIAWATQQRVEFNQFKEGLNPIQRYAFDKMETVLNTASDIIFIWGPTGTPNAIETELNVFANIPLLEGGLGVSVTVDNRGSFTFTGSGMATLTSDISANVGASLGQIKGFGTRSKDLGTGEAVSTIADVSIVHVAVDKNSKLGELLKLRPIDIFAGYEEGYTQKGTYWDLGTTDNIIPAQDQFFFKGGYVGGTVGWDGLYKVNASPLYKWMKLDNVTIGRTYEYAAKGYTTEPSIIGRVTYNIFDIFH